MSKSPRQRKKRFSDKKTEKLVSLYETLKPRANSEWELYLKSLMNCLLKVKVKESQSLLSKQKCLCICYSLFYYYKTKNKN